MFTKDLNKKSFQKKFVERFVIAKRTNLLAKFRYEKNAQKILRAINVKGYMMKIKMYF